jgi:hypothetical protein
MSGIDPEVHKRFLDYRERFIYFGAKTATPIGQEEFAVADAEHRALDAKGDARDDEEEQRFAELAKLLFRD